MTGAKEATAWYRRALDVLQHGVRVDRAWNEERRCRESERGRTAEQIEVAGHADLYQYLGLAHLRLNELKSALNALQTARQRKPGDAKLHQNVAALYHALGEPRQAAVTMLEGLTLAPTRPDFVESLARLYREFDPGGCALRIREHAVAIDVTCPIVHQQMCAGMAELAGLFAQAKDLVRRAEIAREANMQGCPTGGRHEQNAR